MAGPSGYSYFLGEVSLNFKVLKICFLRVSRVYPNGLFEFDEIEIEPRTKNFKGFEKRII